jgi:hypothetical protein
MIRGPVNRPRSIWFASLVALFVALGAQILFGNIVPADLMVWSYRSGMPYRIMPEALWISSTVVRCLSFATGGLVAVFLIGALTGRLLSLLVVMALLATVFQQFPSEVNLTLMAFWSLSAPVAVVVGAWVASAKRGVA